MAWELIAALSPCHPVLFLFLSRGCLESVWGSVFIYIPKLQHFILSRVCPPGAWARVDLRDENKREINHFLNEESKLIFSS